MRYADDLLDQALHLARKEPKRPKQASLRRAVSTAYYALFHLLIYETTQNWKRAGERDSLARMFEHSTMRKACASKRESLRHDAAPLSRHLFLIVDTFVRMQQYRHSADYDNSEKWVRSDTLAKLNLVSAAFRSWKAIRSEHSAQTFLLTLLLKDRL